MNRIFFTLFLFGLPVLVQSQENTNAKNINVQCYGEVVSYQINWNYNRDGGSRNNGGIKLKLDDDSAAILTTASIDLLNFWLKILDQDPSKGKVYYFKKSNTEGVLLGNVLSPPGPACLK